MEKLSIDYIRYLEAKRSVDDRSLNKAVLSNFKRLLENASKNHKLRILELGAGTGAMLRRLMDRGFFHHQLEYTMVDHKADVLTYAREMLTDERITGNVVKSVGDTTDLHLASTDGTEHIPSAQVRNSNVYFHQADALQYLAHEVAKFDVVVAAAFLDHVDLDVFLPLVRASLDPESPVRAFYFPINFAAVTRFEPLVDARVISAFHTSMGEMNAGRKRIPRADTGLHVERTVQFHDAVDVTCAASDWKVECNPPEDEAYFVQGIIAFIAGTSQEHIRRVGIKLHEFNAEVDKLQHHLEQKRLQYEAHNTDICGRFLSHHLNEGT